MLIKIYTFPIPESYAASAQLQNSDRSENEQLHIIEDVSDVIVHQGNWMPPTWLHSPVRGGLWGPIPQEIEIESFECSSDNSVRVIDYTTQNGERKRALVKLLAYVCNDNGRTIERVEPYSGAKLSKL